MTRPDGDGQRKRMTVLLVDDDVVSRMVLMHLVDRCGDFTILEAEDGEDAWGQIEAGARPAMIFCDLRMPRLSGMELLARVKARPELGAMPFVLVSAAADGGTMEQAAELGADGYIIKPFDAGQVRAHLARLEQASGSDDEEALAVARRLGIDGARLAAYLGGLDKQLAAAGPDLERLLGAADVDGARARLERLREGCATLGLHGAAAGLAALAGAAAMAPGQVAPLLAGARAAVRRLLADAHALPGAR